MSEPTAEQARLVEHSALELSGLIHRREVSCVDVMTAYLAQIERYNPVLNAIVALRDREELLAEARQRDGELAAGHTRGWMHGFPHAVKDLAAARGLPHTSGSRIFADRVAEADDRYVARLRAAGAVIIGKSNTPEFGLGSQTYNEVWGTTGNPYDPSRTAGGSSGGGAAALAARMVPVADGSDNMGSLRNPPAFNNVIGLRPSWGRVPEPGFIPYGSVNGPMGRTTADVAQLLSTMAGPDTGAPLGIDEDPAHLSADLDRDFRRTRIAWIGDWDGYLATEPGVLALCESALATFEHLGCEVEPALPSYCPARHLAVVPGVALLGEPALRGPLRGPGNACVDEARAGLGDRVRAPPHRPRPHPGGRRPRRLVCRRGRHVRELRLRGGAQRPGVPVRQVGALAGDDRRPTHGHLPPVDGDRRPVDDGRPPGGSHARGPGCARATDGHPDHRKASR